MNSNLFHRLGLTRVFLATLVALASLSTTARASITAGSAHRLDASTASVQNWTLADGTKVQASLVDYSLNSRIISLRHPDGHTSQIHPQDLTALSKLKWLSSDAFLRAVETYQPPEGAAFTVFSRLAIPVTIFVIGFFLAFWFGAATISGERKVKPAFFAFIKSGFATLIVLAIAGFALRAVAEAFGTSPMAPFFQMTIAGGALLSILALASFQVGGGYGLSGGAGIGAVMLSCSVAFVFSAITLYLLPRVLQRPGIDDWFTDHLLAPLGLA